MNIATAIRLGAVLKMAATALLVFLLPSLPGCVRHSTLLDAARKTGARYGFSEVLLQAPPFVLYGQYRPGKGNVLRVYIEGDGHAWLNRTTPSNDPTPHNPIGLQLATADPSQAPILYLARPFQYAGAHRTKGEQRYWTNARMHENVITSLDRAIDKGKTMSGATSVALIGFSGGGGCAVLLAARRTDVAFVGTVAGNIHVAAWTEMHGLSPLDQSLEPYAAAPLLQRIPQRHLSSTDDKIVPPRISAAFCRETGQPLSCRTVSGLAHNGNWAAVWQYDYPMRQAR